jgi:hypothetical protein
MALRHWGIGDKDQYKIGRDLYHVISITRWDPNGKHLKMNPTHDEIDQLFSVFRKTIDKKKNKEYVKKIGKTYLPNIERTHDSIFPLPMRGDHTYSFTLTDIVYAKNVMKKHKPMFAKFLDWNDLALLVKMLKSKKLRKPKLTAQLILAAWTFINDRTLY